VFPPTPVSLCGRTAVTFFLCRQGPQPSRLNPDHVTPLARREDMSRRPGEQRHDLDLFADHGKSPSLSSLRRPTRSLALPVSLIIFVFRVSPMRPPVPHPSPLCLPPPPPPTFPPLYFYFSRIASPIPVSLFHPVNYSGPACQSPFPLVFC